jgi:hypothetical protein
MLNKTGVMKKANASPTWLLRQNKVIKEEITGVQHQLYEDSRLSLLPDAVLGERFIPDFVERRVF